MNEKEEDVDVDGNRRRIAVITGGNGYSLKLEDRIT